MIRRTTYHVYKADCTQASRILMQGKWDEQQKLLHRPRNLQEAEGTLLTWRNLCHLAMTADADDSLVFHAQSALPYLLISRLIFKMRKLVTRRSSPVCVYDLHDLHEKSEERSLWRKFRYNIVRFYSLYILELVVARTRGVRTITVSKGLGRAFAQMYRCEEPGLVLNAPWVDEPSSERPTQGFPLLFFGSTGRFPTSLLPSLRAAGLRLEFYGKGAQLQDLLADWGDVVRYHGEYFPHQMEFLRRHQVLLLVADGGDNFTVSLPNKVFQAVGNGLSVLLSGNFEEIIETFKDLKGAVGVFDDARPAEITDQVGSILRERGGDYLDRAIKFVNELNRNSSIVYKAALHGSHAMN